MEQLKRFDENFESLNNWLASAPRRLQEISILDEDELGNISAIKDKIDEFVVSFLYY
jgi:hypothetical protein